MIKKSEIWYNKYWDKIAWLPFVIGAIISAIPLPVLWAYKLIPEWGLMLCAIPLVGGGFLTSIFRQMEYKDEPSYKCKCGFDVYVSSKEEHDKVCEARI